MESLALGGIVPFSTVDFPGRLAAVLFCRGCGWHCPYCHNAHLRAEAPAVEWREACAALARRAGLLEAVVFSGGEPLLQRALAQALQRVRGLGFETALHTGGASLAAFRAALPLLDWVGFDFKAPFPGYAVVTGAADSGAEAEACLRLLRESGVPFEVRTTVAPGLLPVADLQAMAGTLAGLGIRQWVLQEFRAEGCRDPRLAAASRRAAPLAGLAPALKTAAPGLDIRVRPAHPSELAV
jgi:anaerobic ribonucleoside-triphosphate reductase activating protein